MIKCKYKQHTEWWDWNPKHIPTESHFRHLIFKIDDIIYTEKCEEFQKAALWEKLKR